jgi:hypothetical protein
VTCTGERPGRSHGSPAARAIAARTACCMMHAACDTHTLPHIILSASSGRTGTGCFANLALCLRRSASYTRDETRWPKAFLTLRGLEASTKMQAPPNVQGQCLVPHGPSWVHSREQWPDSPQVWQVASAAGRLAASLLLRPLPPPPPNSLPPMIPSSRPLSSSGLPSTPCGSNTLGRHRCTSQIMKIERTLNHRHATAAAEGSKADVVGGGNVGGGGRFRTQNIFCATPPLTARSTQGDLGSLRPLRNSDPEFHQSSIKLEI